MSTCLSLHKKNKDTTYSDMQSENEILRQQISDLQSQLTLTKKITDMQDEINSLRQQIFNLKTENTRLSNLLPKGSLTEIPDCLIKTITTSKQNEILSSDEEYYSTDEGLDKIDRTCQYCNKEFKYPYKLKRHFKSNKCNK
jgi:predicted nuclease with TOPRIM domain